MDWALRGERAEDMEHWAADNNRVLIAGHTHMPVFFQSSKQPAAPLADPAAGAVDQEALRLARAEWAAADLARLARNPPIASRPLLLQHRLLLVRRGDITGLEITDGEIRLIRWPCVPATAPRLLAPMTLVDVERAARTLD